MRPNSSEFNRKVRLSQNFSFGRQALLVNNVEIRGFVEPSVRRPESLKNRESLSHRIGGPRPMR
jgi:hypothetical protein